MGSSRKWSVYAGFSGGEFDGIPGRAAFAFFAGAAPRQTSAEGPKKCAEPALALIQSGRFWETSTAWMMDRLQGNAAADAAFVSCAGEMFSQTKNWAFVASNIP